MNVLGAHRADRMDVRIEKLLVGKIRELTEAITHFGSYAATSTNAAVAREAHLGVLRRIRLSQTHMENVDIHPTSVVVPQSM